MATKNEPGAFDCYANAEPDEPMFVLLARDEKAPDLVREWVLRRRAADPEKRDDAKEQEALRCAVEMEAWRARNDQTGRCPDCRLRDGHRAGCHAA